MKPCPFNFTPREYQLDVLQQLDEGKKRALLCWTRRAGKDKTSWCYMVKEAARKPGNYFYIFPTKEMAKKALWENVDPITGFKLLDHLPEELIDGTNNQELLIRLKNNSTVRIVGLDTNPDAIRGVAAAGVVFSEFAFSDFEAYKIMVPSIQQSKGWVIINSTPNGRNHYYDMFKMAKSKQDTWVCSLVQTMWPHKDGYVPLVAPSEIQRVIEEDGITIEDAEREYGCSFDAAKKGAIYEEQIEKAYTDGRIGFFPWNPNKPVYTYWDLGTNDDTCVWFAQYEGKKAYFIDFFKANALEIKDYVLMLQEKGYTYMTHYLPHDSRQRTIHTAQRTIDLFVQIARDFHVSGDFIDLARSADVKQDINLVRKRFYLYHFDQHKCKEGLEALIAYHRKYDRKKQVYLDEPVHDWASHPSDAFRMEAVAQDEIIDVNEFIVRSDFDVFDI